MKFVFTNIDRDVGATFIVMDDHPVPYCNVGMTWKELYELRDGIGDLLRLMAHEDRNKCLSDDLPKDLDGKPLYTIEPTDDTNPQPIIDAARKASRENLEKMNAAIIALLDAGAELSELEVLSHAGKPDQWRVRVRRKVCDCGRAV